MPTPTTVTSGNLSNGTVTAIPNADTTPAQYAAAQNQGFKPVTTGGSPSPIAAEGLTTPNSPLTVPPPNPSNPSTTPTVAAPTGTTTDANGNATPPPAQPASSSSGDTQSWIRQQLASLGDALSRKSAATTQAQTDTGLAAKTTQATADYNAYNQAKLALQQKIEGMHAASGGTTGGNSQAIEVATREGNANLANLAVISQSSQGLLDAAQKTIKDKIDAQFQPINDQIDFLTKFSSVNQNDLSESDKFKLQQKADQQKADSAAVQKAATDIHDQVRQNGAPASVYDALDKVTNDYTSGKITPEEAQSEYAKAAGKYGIDQSKVTQEAYQRAETNKLNIENATKNGTDSVSVLDGKGNPISVPTDAAPYLNTSHSGINYIDASTLQGTAAEKKSIIDQAQAAGLKVVLNKNSALDLTNITDAHSKLDTVSTLMSEIDQPSALARDLGGAGLTQLGILAQTDPKAAISQSTGIIGLDILKAVSGVQGFRGNQTAIQQVQDHLPKATDTADVVKGKIEFIRKLLNDRENAIVGKPPAAQQQVTSGTTGTMDGKTYTYNGSGDTSDIKNWTLKK